MLSSDPDFGKLLYNTSFLKNVGRKPVGQINIFFVYNFRFICMVIHPHFIKRMKMLYTSVIINAQVIALQIFFAIIEIWLFVCVCVFFSPIVNFPSSKVWYMDSWTVFFVRKYKLYADKWHNHYYNRSLSFILCEQYCLSTTCSYILLKFIDTLYLLQLTGWLPTLWPHLKDLLAVSDMF